MNTEIICERKLKCKNCEHMIVDAVNKDCTRGSGTCEIRKVKNGLWCTYFSNIACKDFVTRISSLEIGEGGNIIEAVKRDNEIRDNKCKNIYKWIDKDGIDSNFFYCSECGYKAHYLEILKTNTKCPGCNNIISGKMTYFEYINSFNNHESETWGDNIKGMLPKNCRYELAIDPNQDECRVNIYVPGYTESPTISFARKFWDSLYNKK